jgi:hypothetical protein
LLALKSRSCHLFAKILSTLVTCKKEVIGNIASTGLGHKHM